MPIAAMSTRRWLACCRGNSLPEVLDLVALGLNHEQQHQELILTDVKNGLALNPTASCVSRDE